jgi:hypothetical protein
MNLTEAGWEGVDRFNESQYRDEWWAVVNTVMNIQVP